MNRRAPRTYNHFTPALSRREPEGCLLGTVALAAVFGLSLATLTLSYWI